MSILFSLFDHPVWLSSPEIGDFRFVRPNAGKVFTLSTHHSGHFSVLRIFYHRVLDLRSDWTAPQRFSITSYLLAPRLAPLWTPAPTRQPERLHCGSRRRYSDCTGTRRRPPTSSSERPVPPRQNSSENFLSASLISPSPWSPFDLFLRFLIIACFLLCLMRLATPRLLPRDLSRVQATAGDSPVSFGIADTSGSSCNSSETFSQIYGLIDATCATLSV